MDKRAKFLKKSKEKIQETLKSRDMIIGSVSKTIVELDAAINVVGERLEDWYAIYFPELKSENKLDYAKAVLTIDRKNLDQNKLEEILGKKNTQRIVERAPKTLGADLEKEDMEQIQKCAKLILDLDTKRKEYEQYQKKLCDEICPNLAYIAGPEIAAKLIAHIGSLKRLALLPASTIQIVGAEKALFKHLKNRRIKPPKHGIIFQYARISGSPKAVRGKIARALANALCTAVKADAITKNNIAPLLKDKLDKKIKYIMEQWERQKKSEVNTE